MESGKKYIIFSFDGGGARMVVQYQILKRIVEKFPNILEKVNVFAGTSAGSILSAGLASGIVNFKDDNLINKKNVDEIFSSYTFFRKIKTFGGLSKCKYTNDKLKNLLTIHFNSMTISSLDKGLYITAFCINPAELEKKIEGEPSWLKARVKRWSPVYYTNIESKSDKIIVDAILESSAAPTYFPIVNNHIDGGIGNNNPSLSILAKLISTGVKMNDIYMLSFGSGERPTVLETTDLELGTITWLKNIIDMIFDAEQEITSKNAYNILGDNFWRIQPLFDKEVELDDTSQYDFLVETANNFNLKNTFEWLERLL